MGTIEKDEINDQDLNVEHHDFFTPALGGDVVNGQHRKVLTRRLSSLDDLDEESENVIGRVSSRLRRRNFDLSWLGFCRRLVASEDEENDDFYGSSDSESCSSSSLKGSQNSLLDSDEPHRWCSSVMGGLRSWSPGGYEWVRGRLGPRKKMTVVFCFLIFETLKFELYENAMSTGLNPYSLFFMANFASALLGWIISFMFDGFRCIGAIFQRERIKRMVGVAFLFMVAEILSMEAYTTGLSPALVNLIGKLYLPFAAVASYVAFSRKYGLLEWLSLTITMLSISAVMLLRDRCHYNYCGHLDFSGEYGNIFGVSYCMIAVVTSATASIMMERILQAKYSTSRSDETVGYWIYRVELDTLTSIGWLVIFISTHFIKTNSATRVVAGAFDVQVQAQGAQISTEDWFGQWHLRQGLLLAVLVGQRWFAGLIVQSFSTVTKGILSTSITLFAVLFNDGLTGKYDLQHRLGPTSLITVIVVLSALIFQTGRLNLKRISQYLKEPQKSIPMTPHELAGKVAKRIRKASLHPGSWRERLGPVMEYSIIIYYIVADTSRTILQNIVNANRYVVPQTMATMVSVMGVVFAGSMILSSHGWDGLKRALTFKKIVKFSLCGLLSAITQSLMGLAFALGTTASMAVGLGKIYTPIVAILSRFILGRFFMWMEWFALVMLTSAALAFCMLDSGHSTTNNTTGMMMVAGSATTSAVMSLVMEKFMKGENEPFLFQKLRLDIGSVFFGLLLLPLMGALGTSPGNMRQDLAFWVYRPGPDYWACYDLAVDYPRGAMRGCDQDTGSFHVNWTLVGNSTLLKEQASECVCGRGVFLGWGSNMMIYVFLLVAVFHGWIIGRLVSSPRFSSVDRAVADGIPLLLIYFFMNPLASRVPWAPFRAAYPRQYSFPPRDWVRDLVCFILPLSAWTFAKASSQMKKVMDLEPPIVIGDEVQEGEEDKQALRSPSISFGSDSSDSSDDA
mmetsp:Transcript_16992/g.36605  ORF Transcript_16992/g.36605 Transcript_16992/m.36605 type:complete len:963 (-) Transcript_16992:78-2966(-)